MLIEDGLFDGQLMHTQVQGDGTRLPFPDNTFDKIIASEVLEHIPDDVAAYDEFFRILKPGGSIAATVPATFPEKICWKLSDEYYAPKAEGGHVRIYTEDEVREKLRGAYAEDANGLVAASQVVALNFQTVASANGYWREGR